MRRAAAALILCALILGGWIVASRNGGPTPAVSKATDESWITLSCEHMATVIQVTIQNDDRAPEALQIVSDVFGSVDRDMSEWKENSPLTHVNRMAGREAVRVPHELMELLRLSLELAAATDGAFDPTWAALWGLWDFKAEPARVPPTDEIERRTALIDYMSVEIESEAGTVYLPEQGMVLGLGGIAKGYALDVAAVRLRDAGIGNFLILAGGQVYAGGSKGERAWRVGIRDPRGPVEDMFATVELKDASLSTSGDYERYFEVDARRYHHILDPRTGWPSEGVRSVTVISSRAVLADVMSTALMVASPSRHQKIMDRVGLEWALVVDDTGRVSQRGENPPTLTMLKDPRAE